MSLKTPKPPQKKIGNEETPQQSIPLYPDEQFQIDTLNEKPTKSKEDAFTEKQENEKSSGQLPKDPFDEDPTSDEKEG